VVVVHPPLLGYLSAERAEALAADGLFGDTVDGLRTAWSNVSARWDDAVARATAGPASGRLDERVAGEWSFVETLRHLVFVTDVWIGEVVRESDAFHRWGLPPDFVAEQVVPLRGLAVDERPSLRSVLEVRASRRAMVAEELSSITPSGLARVCPPRGGQFTVVGAVQTVVHEELAHLSFALRDLAVLER
jgi:hypothetical protein